MSLNIRKIFRNAAIAAALIGTTAPLASQWRTISVRPDDNASRILDAHGVSARTLAALLDQPDIAKRLQLVHVGDTIELFVVDGELRRFRLFDGSRVGLGGRVTREGKWRTRTINLNDYGNIAARIRLIEASESQVVDNKSRNEGPQVVLAPSPPTPPVEAPAEMVRPTQISSARTNIADDIRNVERVIGARIRDSRTSPIADTSPPVTPSATATATATAPLPAKTAKVARAVVTATTAKPSQGTAVAKVKSKTKSPEAAPAQVVTKAAKQPPKVTTPTIAAQKITPRPAASATVATVKPASPAPSKVMNTVAKPSPPKVNQQITRTPSCPSIAGRWQAHYATFECDAEVLFAPQTGDAFKMKQKGCGGIAGVVEQDDRKLLGQWKHTLCKGELHVELDSSCTKGSGTWRAAPGQRLCQAKPYPVTITRLDVAKTTPSSKSSSASSSPESNSDDR